MILMPCARDYLKRWGKSETPRDILRAPEFKDLYAQIAKLPAEERSPLVNC